jgi:predicted site-specific integrase-resolvase
MSFTVSEYAQVVGVHSQTLRRWEREGRPGLVSPTRTLGNHRRYAAPRSGRVTVGYARVSCHDQQADLPRQIQRLRQHAGPDTLNRPRHRQRTQLP